MNPTPNSAVQVKLSGIAQPAQPTTQPQSIQTQPQAQPQATSQPPVQPSISQVAIQQKLQQAPQIQMQQNPQLKVAQPIGGLIQGQPMGAQQLQQLHLQQMQLQQLQGQQSAQQLQMLQEENEILSRRKLQELVSQISPHERLDADVEEVLLELVDDFIESVTTFACNLAKHRNSNTLEVKDLVCHLERNCNIRVPGYGTTENVRPYKRPQISDAHKQRLNLVRKTLAPPSKQQKLQ
jgi:transcription initiation factor TFIID subunit 12